MPDLHDIMPIAHIKSATHECKLQPPRCPPHHPNNGPPRPATAATATAATATAAIATAAIAAAAIAAAAIAAAAIAAAAIAAANGRPAIPRARSVAVGSAERKE